MDTLMQTLQVTSIKIFADDVPLVPQVSERTCPAFHTGDRDYCDGDEPDVGQRYCDTCRKAAEGCRTAAEDEKEQLMVEGSWTNETRAEYRRLMALCGEVLGK